MPCLQMDTAMIVEKTCLFVSVDARPTYKTLPTHAAAIKASSRPGWRTIMMRVSSRASTTRQDKIVKQTATT